MQAVELVNACSVIASFLACCRHSARLVSTASEAVFVPTVILLWKTADLVLRFWTQQIYGMCSYVNSSGSDISKVLAGDI